MRKTRCVECGTLPSEPHLIDCDIFNGVAKANQVLGPKSWRSIVDFAAKTWNVSTVEAEARLDEGAQPWQDEDPMEKVTPSHVLHSQMHLNMLDAVAGAKSIGGWDLSKEGKKRASDERLAEAIRELDGDLARSLRVPKRILESATQAALRRGSPWPVSISGQEKRIDLLRKPPTKRRIVYIQKSAVSPAEVAKLEREEGVRVILTNLPPKEAVLDPASVTENDLLQENLRPGYRITGANDDPKPPGSPKTRRLGDLYPQDRSRIMEAIRYFPWQTREGHVNFFQFSSLGALRDGMERIEAVRHGVTPHAAEVVGGWDLLIMADAIRAASGWGSYPISYDDRERWAQGELPVAKLGLKETT